jgi:hypothetical protein
VVVRECNPLARGERGRTGRSDQIGGVAQRDDDGDPDDADDPAKRMSRAAALR